MIREIGSEFWLDAESVQRSGFLTKTHFEKRFLMSGRCAIYHVLQEMSSSDSKKVAYLPAYICHTVIDPFIKAKYKIVYYDVDATLKPVFEEKYLDQLSVVLISDYFGFINDNSDFIRACKEHDITIIEDMSHSMFSKTINPEVDYSIGSLRKWVGIPAGGWAVSTQNPFRTETLKYHPDYVESRLEALKLRKAYIETGNEEYKTFSMQLFSKAETLLEHGFDVYGGDPVSDEIVASLPYQNIIKKRRRNYEILLGGLRKNSDIKAIFHELSSEICPMFFPIISDNRDMIKDLLLSNKIYPPIHWPIPKAIDIEKYPQAKRIYESILSIPCDQRYDKNDMYRVCEVLNA